MQRIGCSVRTNGACSSFMISSRAIFATIEAAAIEALVPRIGEDFVAICECILACQGRVVVTGMGKSGHVGRKIAATLASTGTPAFFVHPAEASHGDLGMITQKDVVLALSNSGETAEVNATLPVARKIGAEVIATPGCESNVKEIYDKCWEIKRTRPDCLIFNQFEEFGNAIWHYVCTGRAMEEVFEAVRHAQGDVGMGKLAQPVRVTGPDGRPVLAMYHMERQADGSWRINGVTLLRHEETRRLLGILERSHGRLVEELVDDFVLSDDHLVHFQLKQIDKGTFLFYFLVDQAYVNVRILCIHSFNSVS